MVRNRLTFAAAVITAAAIGLAGCSSSEEPAPTPDATSTSVAGEGIPASLIGMHVEGVEVEAWPSAPFGSLRLWDNGTAWSQVELTKGEFKWDNLEGALANAESKGMTDILQVLGTTPEWAASKVTEPVYPPYPGANSAPKNIEDWDAWVTAVATRYKGRIAAYQIWNEANLKQFFNGTPEQMVELTKHAYDIIKSIDPDALVVGASPALRLTSAFDRFFAAYLEGLAAEGWPVDVIAIHTYPPADGNPVTRRELVAKAQAAITAAGAPETIQLWDTELNYGLAGPGDKPKQEITGPAAAGWIVRTYIDNLRLGIDRTYWYIWTQKPYDLLGIQAYPGSEGEQGFFALDNWVVGSSLLGCDAEATAVVCDFERDGQRSIVAWSEGGDFTMTAPDNARLVCDPMANCVETSGGAQLTLTEIPVRIYMQ